MRTTKTALRKIKQWESNPMMVTGLYRMLTYIPWNDIPEKYKSFFPEEAKNVWDDDLKDFGKANIELDLKSEITAILRLFAKRNIVSSLGMVSIVLADVYMYEVGIGVFEGKLSKILEDYMEYSKFAPEEAEQLAFISTVDLFCDIVKKTKIDLGYDIKEVADKLNTEYEKSVKNAEALDGFRKATGSNNTGLSEDELNALVDEALEKEKKLKDTSEVGEQVDRTE